MKHLKKYIYTISIILVVLTPSLLASGKQEVQKEEVVIKEEATKAEYHKINVVQAKAAIDEQDDILVIDVRTSSEYASGHIPNSINIPLNVIESTVLEKYPEKDTKLYVYCRSGNRSAQAAKLLVSQGYTNVYDFGGIIDWPYEVVK